MAQGVSVTLFSSRCVYFWFRNIFGDRDSHYIDLCLEYFVEYIAGALLLTYMIPSFLSHEFDLNRETTIYVTLEQGRRLG